MSKYDDMMSQWNADCLDEIQDAVFKTNAVIETDVEQFQRNTLDNIEQNFGDFLYTALGDRVTGQRSSILNTKLFTETDAGKQIAEDAKAKNQTIEEHLVEVQKTTGYTSSTPIYMRHNKSKSNPIQLFITAGRKFGVSYYTGAGDRVHTIYFGAGKCFKYLTQDHVECIKNKLKKQCAQDFLNFRDDFVEGLAEIGNKIIETPVDVKLAVMSSITKSRKINSNSGTYNDNSKSTYTIIDEVIDGKVTHMMCNIPDMKIWDGVTPINSHNVKFDVVTSPSYLSFTLMNIDEKDISILGNFDIGIESMAHSLQVTGNFSTRQVENHIEEAEQHYSLNQNPAMRTTLYAHKRKVDSEGVLLELDKVLQNPTIHGEILKQIKFYNDMSLRLQALKHDHASLYFIHADI